MPTIKKCFLFQMLKIMNNHPVPFKVLTLCSSLWKLAAKAIWNWLQCRISDSSELEQLVGLFIPAMGMKWLFGCCLVGNAKELWDHIKYLFHDNKYAHSITLDNEIRSRKIVNLTINTYCTKIRAMADRLKNHGEKVSDKNLVMYTINGLDSHFKVIVHIIRHRELLPTFKTTRNMLLLEENALKKTSNVSSTSIDSTSSSFTILMATKQSPCNNSGPPACYSLWTTGLVFCWTFSRGFLLDCASTCP
ncbi:hypothetical protein CTI12_AA425140 [Artemisia annua]|uniref:Hybrid signal transduction histidine kinase M n=1 Tax=Artemisia annua TaxID=35608 RepID=A0A2U1M2C7_ARTAN|nr:hypothetical protein CTI12_AA425140 [Artemisia annua]